MRKLLFLALLLALSLSACMPSNDNEPMTVYKYGMVHIDSLGQVEFMPMPAISRQGLFVERLPDGRILMIHDSLHIYDPVTRVLTDVTPFGNYSQFSFPATDLSPDGLWLYHHNIGAIRRFNTKNNNSELMAVSPNGGVVRPTISRDGRYLTYLHSRESIFSITHNGGFPYVFDLETGTTTNLSTGEDWIDNSNTYAWMARGGERLYYISSATLRSMNPDGTNRNVVRDAIELAWESYDGKILLCRESSLVNHLDLCYRNNETMTWYEIGNVGSFQLSRGSNILYHSSGGKLYKLDLETNVQTTLFTNTLQGRKITGIGQLAPSWNGKDIVFIATFQEWDKPSKYPL